MPTTCPECNAPHSADAPFCEECGYRLRRSETVLEGHPAIPKSLLDRHESARSSTDRARETQPERGAVPSAARSSREAATVPEGHRVVTPEMVRRHADGTIVEGLHEVGNSATEPTDERPEVRPSEVSALLHVEDGEARGTRRAMWAILWVASVAAAAMIVHFYGGERDAEVEAPRVEPATRTALPVPAGEFRRGLDDETQALMLFACQRMSDTPERCRQDELFAGEYPQEVVALPAFAIDATEVTVKEWDRCVQDGACAPIDFKSCRVYTHQGLQVSLRVPKLLREPQMPVTCVTRDEAAAFCAWEGARLPTHDEWEKAARGTEGRLYAWGNHWDFEAANWGELDVARVPALGKLDGWEWVAPPGSYPRGKSPFGVLDATGNVAEWIAGSEPDLAHVRGGAWTSTPFELRTTRRHALDAASRRTDVGFRCARDR